MLGPGAVHSNAPHQTIRIRRKIIIVTLPNEHNKNSVTRIRPEASKVIKGHFHNNSKRNSLLLHPLLFWDTGFVHVIITVGSNPREVGPNYSV